MGRHRPDDPAGPLLAPSEQVEQAAEGAEQDDPHGGGHHDEDRRGRRPVPVQLGGRHVEAVEHQEAHQREPEQDIEHHRRTDALGAEGEPGVGPGHPGLGEEAVAEGGARSGATGGHVAQGQGGQVDPEEAEPTGTVGREDRVGELGVGDEGGDLEQYAQRQVGDVDVGERLDLTAVAGEERQGDVEDEEEHEHGAHADPHFAPGERAAVPPAVPMGATGRFSLRRLRRRDLHPCHVVTARPLGPVMLHVWPRTTTCARGSRRIRRRS